MDKDMISSPTTSNQERGKAEKTEICGIATKVKFLSLFVTLQEEQDITQATA